MEVKEFIEVGKNNFPFYFISDNGCLTEDIVLKRFGNKEIKEFDFIVDVQNERLANSDRLFKPTLSIVPKLYLKDEED